MNSKFHKRILGAVMAGAIGFCAAPLAADTGAVGAATQVANQNKWAVMAGTSLKETLEGWTSIAGWTLIWDSPIDYRMRASATFHGPFEVSAASLIDSIYNGNPELMATFHRGNRVLHIENQPLSSN
jgi:hypothetical protein